MRDRSAGVLLFRVLLAVTTAFVFYSAFAPPGSVPHLLAWDKAEHFVAFYVLAMLAALALPSLKLVRIGIALSLLGAIIELAQGMPEIHRDSDLFDWVTDTIAILCAFCPTLLDKVRARLRETEN